MLKRKLTKEEFNALTKELQAFYKDHNGEYLLQAEDAGELQRALDREREDGRKQKERADNLATELTTLKEGTARSSGDIVTLETSYKKKLTDQKTDYDGKLQKKDGIIKKSLINERAQALATKLAGDNAEILLPHILPRLTADLESEVPVTRVLDAAGQLSALTLEDLEKEFVANKKFSAIIVASRASGSATGKNSGTSAVPNGKKFQELTEAERVKWYKDDPTGFAEASKQAQAAARA